MNVKLLILDIDGVLTDGTKVYDKNHNVLSKRFVCKDFTAIKRFIAAGVKVVMLSGDDWNRKMAEKRNVDFYCTRGDDLSLDKSVYLPMLEKKYNVPVSEMAFVGDDYFDFSMFENLTYTFCPLDAPAKIREEAYCTINKPGGHGIIVELYDYFIQKGWIQDAPYEAVAALDKMEVTSQEMK